MSHTSHLPLSSATVSTGVRHALRRVPPTILQGVMAVAVLGALGPGAISAMPQVQPDALVHAAPASAPEAPARAERPRCAGCGFVQSIRHVEAAGLVPAAYEFTVRMRDGSVRISSDPSAGKWIVGDRIILVGGSHVALN